MKTFREDTPEMKAAQAVVHGEAWWAMNALLHGKKSQRKKTAKRLRDALNAWIDVRCAQVEQVEGR